MRRRVAGFLLALTLLALAIPATLGGCLGPPNAGAHAHVAAAAVLVQDTSTTLVHDCIDHSAPAPNPYIETSNGSGGGGTATSRTSTAAADLRATSSVATAPIARRYSVAANDTGPPLWLSTCVSRT